MYLLHIIYSYKMKNTSTNEHHIWLVNDMILHSKTHTPTHTHTLTHIYIYIYATMNVFFFFSLYMQSDKSLKI